MNILLKISLLLCLGVSSTTYASSVSDEDIPHKRTLTEAVIDTQEPEAKPQQVLETDIPATNTRTTRMRHSREIDTPLATEESKRMIVFNDSVLLIHIASLLYDEDKPSEALVPIAKDGDTLEALKDLRLVSKIWYQTFNHKYGLTYVFPCFKDIISNAEDDATSPFRVVSANVASFKPLDLGINLISHLLISGNGEVVLYDSNNLPSTQWHNHEIYNNGAYKKYNVKTGKISDLEQCNGVSGITEDGKTIFGHTRLTPEGGDPIAALWENGQEKRTLLPCLSNVYGISQDKTILGRPQTEEQSNNLVLCKNREITERIALSFKGCNLLPDGKTILGYDNKTEAVIWHNRKISKMPKGFTWPFVRSKGQRIIGVRDDHLAEYIDEYKIVRALPIYVDTAQVINDGLIAYDHPYPGYVEPSTRIWKDGSCYPVFQLLKK